METGTEVASRPATAHHVDAFDGIRAVAILMVLGLHLHLVGVPFRVGGFLGVDVFFVLSGFLITSLLVAEHDRRGRVALRGFFARRALRLVPVAVVLLVAGLGVYLLTPSSYGLRPQPIALAAYIGSWMNWLDVWRPLAGGMFAHAWSLAIEAQFYVGYPLLLVLAWRFRLRLRTVALLLGALVIAAVAARVWIWHGVPAPVGAAADPMVRYANGAQRGEAWARSYFNTFTHLDGLLVGALAAFLVASASRREVLAHHRAAVRAAMIGGILVVAAVVIRASSAGVSAFVPVYGLLPLELGVAALVVGLLVVPGSAVGRFLGLAPLVWIGRRSYAMYMLHIPVWMLVGHLELGSRVLASRPRAASGWISFALTIVAAELSFRFVESPALALKGRLSGRG